MISRRHFLGASLALPLLPHLARASDGTIALEAGKAELQLHPELPQPTQMLGFNGSFPGPVIRGKRDEKLEIDLINGLEEGTAVHWHGLRIENAMDGVPVLTQDIVNPGETFSYRFTPPDAGTYWYHSHYISYEQVARGLMGALIVEEDTPPDVDHDVIAILADWRLDEMGAIVEDFGQMHDISHAGRLGNFAKAILSEQQVPKGARIRLRMINAATDRVFPIALSGLSGKTVALDGMPLATPREIGTPILAPAQRVDIIADVEGPIELQFIGGDQPYSLGGLELSDMPLTARTAPIAPLEANKIAQPGEIGQSFTMRLQGGAMAAGHAGNNIWALNDVSDFGPEPFARIARGETVKFTMVNETVFPHGMHLHGHHFYELGSDGTLGDLRDTTLIAPNTSQEILCVFDNPGKWMLHCHMLSHQVGGMKTWVQVG